MFSRGLALRLDLNTSTKLNLYAALTHQTSEQAAQEIVKEFLSTVGEARIQHRIERYVDDVNALAEISRVIVPSAGQEAVLKIS